jgi:hypothetical protein
MIKKSYLFTATTGVLAFVLSVLPGSVSTVANSLTGPVRHADGSLVVTLNGTSGEQVMLQGSLDMKAWSDLQSYQLDGPKIYQQPADGTQRYFRLKSVENNPTGTTLPSLADSQNSVFVAGEGFDTVQFAPNGNLGLIFWKGRDLMIRERYTSGGWIEQKVSEGGNLFQMNVTRTDYKFQPAALLLYDSNSQPHIFRAAGGKTIAHHARSGSNWTQVETLENTAANANISMLVGAIGAGNKFHLAAVTGSSSPNLSYGSNRNGSWSWNNVTSVGALPAHYLAPSYAPRWLSLAVDSNNAAHLLFRPEYRVAFVGGYARAYNELAYASNKSGQWSVQVIQKPRDDSGEAGHGLSVAIGPENKPYIASWHNERGPGGSAENSRLFFQSQDGSGNWTRTEVISRPEGYIAGDGEKGTGFAPYLRFDVQGRPHIVFLDHASEHFGESGQSEYAGHIRHAWLQNGQWQIESIYRQTSPMLEQMIYPAFAMSGNEIVVTGLQRETQWNMSGYPPTVNSTYRYVYVAAPLR